jgi:phosphoglycolate phosphatase
VKNLVIRAVPEGELNPQFNNVFTLFRTYYLEHCQDNTRPYIGINEVLSKLKRHDIGMAIVSNKLQAGVTELNKRWFSEFIDIAIGEREGINRKPLPDMLNIAMKELNAKAEETVYIGDSDTDFLTAKNAGVQCISVLWGFRDRDFLLEHGATNFASSPKELIAMILHNK